MEARQSVMTFATSMTGLMEILLQETDVLKTRKYTDLTGLQSKKTQLAKGYAEAQRRIEGDLDALDALSTEERTDLRKLYKRFRDVLAENMLALRGAHDATDRVIKLIIQTVKDQRGVKTAPSAFGPRGSGYAAYSNHQTASIALSTET